jgi:hypothetical protein
MSSETGRRVVYAAMAFAAVLIMGAGAATLIDNGEASESAVQPSTTSGETPGTDIVSPTPEPEVTSQAGNAPKQTLYGASFERKPGESYPKALRRTDASLGKLGVVRVFYRRMPKPWPGKAPGRDVIVSFRLEPSRVLAGEYDAYMRKWFATVPIGLNVYWTNYHEPEDEIEAGKFKAADYRASFERLNRLADESPNPRLKSTVVLMSWSARPASGRKWRSYVPDPASVDVLAWDIYNRRRDVYPDPVALLEAAQHDSETIGKPFAIAELASVLARGDKGSGRAEWLKAMGAFAEQHDAAFVSYFDVLWNNGKDDFRLLDAPSMNAWKAISGD